MIMVSKMKFIVDKKFFEKIPNACFGVIIAKNIDNKQYDWVKELLDEQVKNIQIKYENQKAKEIPEIMLYREAFRQIDINPNKFMCAIESLVSRTLKQGFVPNINSLVDLGNALSLKYIIPLGIHDIDKLKGDIELRFANEEDIFIPFNGEEETPDLNEVIYASGHDVRTRRWTWRQGENGKVDENIKSAFIPLDAFTENKDNMLKLQQELKELLSKMGADCILGYVDKDNNVFEW